MREILFRGKDKNWWVYGGIIHQTDYYGDEVDDYYIIDGTHTFENDIGDNYKIKDPSTIGQFTGLLDKNDNKIFEGDIVRVQMRKAGEAPNYMIGSVEYLKGAFCVKWVDTQYGRSFVGYLEDIEVIGNIHDNHELLEGF